MTLPLALPCPCSVQKKMKGGATSAKLKGVVLCKGGTTALPEIGENG